MKTKKEVALRYLKLLEQGKIDRLIELFEPEGIVDSPVYGIKTAREFYRELSEDTRTSELQLLGIFEDSDSGKLAVYFEYRWTLATNKIVEFDVVDIIEFTEANKISRLKIIYDTVTARGLIRGKG